MTKAMHHLVTGANGYVGSNLVRALLAQGHRVTALARCSAEELQEELNQAVVAEGMPLSADELEQLNLWQYRLDQDDLGLADAGGFDSPLCCWHSAAFMSFSSLALQESWQANVVGTQRLCHWFRQHAPQGSRFHYLSTAYTCGRSATNLSERFYPDEAISAFHNPYEYTKRNAEFVVREFAKTTQMPTLVLRLGQIVGMSTTGATTSDLGLFGGFRLLNQLGKKNVKQVRLGASVDAHLHLVAIDVCIKALLRHQNLGVGVAGSAQIVHLVPPRPVLLRNILDVLERHSGVAVELIDPTEADQPSLNRVDQIVARQLRELMVYIQRTYQFEHHTGECFSACELNLSAAALEHNVSHYFQQ